MAFGAISTLYLPTAANAGASQWGTDVRKLLDSADAGSDATTTTSHGTSGAATTRTNDPYTATTADLDQSLYGWAVTPSDMNSVSGAKRFYPAGDHTATIRMGHNAVVGGASTLFMYVYRVASAAGSRTRTLLGSGSAAFTLPAGGGEVTAVVTTTLPEVVFEPDETIQYSFETESSTVVITGRVVKFFTGTQTSVACRIDTPPLKTLADTTGSAAGSGAAGGVAGKVLGTNGSATGSGVAAGSMSARADTTGSASGSAVASGSASSVAGTTGAAAGSGQASGVLTGIGSMTGSASGAGVAAGVLGAIGSMAGSASGTSAANGVLGAIGGMVGSALGAAAATGFGSSVAGTVGSATGSATVAGLTSIVLGTVGSVEIGAPTSETPDWPVVAPTRQVAGIVQHHETTDDHTAGDPVDGATVRLYRDVDKVLISSATTGPDGLYSFTRDADDPYTYFATANYDDAGTPIQGMTPTAVPTLI